MAPAVLAGAKIFSKKVLTNKTECAIIETVEGTGQGPGGPGAGQIEMEEMKMKWHNVELNIVEAEKLHQELMEHNIKHEMSAAYNLIHFEILLNEAQVNSMNKLIDNIRKRNGAIFNV